MPSHDATAPQERRKPEESAPDDAPRSVYVVPGDDGGGKGILGVLLALLVLGAVAMLAVYLLTMAARPQA